MQYNTVSSASCSHLPTPFWSCANTMQCNTAQCNTTCKMHCVCNIVQCSVHSNATRHKTHCSVHRCISLCNVHCPVLYYCVSLWSNFTDCIAHIKIALFNATLNYKLHLFYFLRRCFRSIYFFAPKLFQWIHITIDKTVLRGGVFLAYQLAFRISKLMWRESFHCN